MGVNWQQNDYYFALKQQEKDTGITVAEQNAMANPGGVHKFGGLLISNILPTLLVGVGESIDGVGLNGSGDTGSATDTKNETAKYKNLKLSLNNLDTAISVKDKANTEKYLAEIKKLKDDNPNDKQIARTYENAVKKAQNKGLMT